MAPRTDEPQRETVASATNAIRLLALFRDADGDLGVTQMARGIGVGKSTAHRLVQALVDGGMLEKSDDGRRYRLTLLACELGMAVTIKQQLRRAAGPVINSLRRQGDASVYVAVLDGAETVVLDFAEGTQAPDRRSFPIRNSADQSALGLALLAERRGGGAELADARRLGYAVCNHGGVTSVAAVIRSSDGAPIAAVAIVPRQSQLDAGFGPKLGRLAREAASLISARLSQHAAPEAVLRGIRAAEVG